MAVYLHLFSVTLACFVSLQQLNQSIKTEFNTGKMKYSILDQTANSQYDIPTSIVIKQGIICRAEDKIYKNKMGVSFRLGSLNYVNKIEKTQN